MDIILIFASLENALKTINPFAYKSRYLGNEGVCRSVYQKKIFIKELFFGLFVNMKKIMELKKNLSMECQVNFKDLIKNPLIIIIKIGMNLKIII